MEPWSELPGTFLVGLCHMMPWTQVKVVRLVCKGWCAALDGALQKCTSLRVSSADFARPDRVARLPTLFSTFPNVRTVLIEQADDEEPGRRAAVLPALQGLVSLLSSSGTAASRVPAIQELAVRMPQYAAMSFFFRDDQTSAGLAGVLAGCLRSAAAGRGALAGLRTLRLDGLVLAYPTHSMDPLSREPYPPDDAPAAQNQGTAEQAELAAAAALAADAARLQRADDLGALLQRPLFHGLPALRSLDLVNTNACGALLMDVAHLTQLTRLVLRPGVAFGYKTRSEAAAVFHGLRTLFWSLSNLRHLELDASINYARPFHPGIATVELELQRALLSSRLPHLTSLHMSPCLPPQRASPEDMDAARQLAQTVLPFPRHHQLQLFPAHALQMTSLTVYNLDAAHCHAVRSMPALQVRGVAGAVRHKGC